MPYIFENPFKNLSFPSGTFFPQRTENHMNNIEAEAHVLNPEPFYDANVPEDKIQAYYMSWVWEQIIRESKVSLSEKEEEAFYDKFTHFLNASVLRGAYMHFICKKGIKLEIEVDEHELPSRMDFRENPDVLEYLVQRKAHKQYHQLPNLPLSELAEEFVEGVYQYVENTLQEYGVYNGIILLKKYIPVVMNKLEQDIGMEKDNFKSHLQQRKAEEEEVKMRVQSILGTYRYREKLVDLTCRRVMEEHINYFFFGKIFSIMDEIRAYAAGRIYWCCGVYLQLINDAEDVFTENLNYINDYINRENGFFENLWKKPTRWPYFDKNKVATGKVQYYLKHLAQEQADRLRDGMVQSFMKNSSSEELKNMWMNELAAKNVIIEDFQNILKAFLQEDLQNGLIRNVMQVAETAEEHMALYE